MTADFTNGKISGSLSGAVLDFSPTLLQIQSENLKGAPVSYYILVPNASAIIKAKVDER